MLIQFDLQAQRLVAFDDRVGERATEEIVAGIHGTDRELIVLIDHKFGILPAAVAKLFPSPCPFHTVVIVELV